MTKAREFWINKGTWIVYHSEEEAKKGAWNEYGCFHVREVLPTESYSKQFEQFWKAYPTTPTMSKKKAWTAFKALSEKDRQKAIEAAPAYAKQFKEEYPTASMKHAQGYLNGRLFDNFTKQEQDAAKEHWTFQAGSKQFRAWKDWMMNSMGWRWFPKETFTAPMEWPPSTENSARDVAVHWNKIAEQTGNGRRYPDNPEPWRG